MEDVMRDVSMSGASGHGEEPMADPCVNARRTRRITARQSHLPKIRDDRKSVDRHEQIGLRYGSRSSTIGPASSRLKRKPASSRTARRQAADRVLMCTGFWRPPAKSPSVRCREPRACASCLPHQGRELWLLDCARLCPYYWPKKGNHLRSSRCATSLSRRWFSSAFIPRIVAVDLSQGGATLQMKLS